MRLPNKIALITGAAAGIGKATAEFFVREGATVVIADRDDDSAAKIARELGQTASAFTVEVSKGAQVPHMMDDTVARFGRLDILVNNAGYGIRGNVATTAEQDRDTSMDVNLKGVFLCSKYAVPHMIAQGGGSIVNTSSTIAIVGIPDRVVYVASKNGVASLTRASVLDHAADKIRVNSVAPGVIWSSYYEKMLEKNEDPDTFLAKLKARAPTNRRGEPHEIATVILWLASDEASFATVRSMTIDGRYTAW